MSQQQQFKRIEYLDSIRGIAAMMVVVYHFIGWKWKDELAFHLGALFFNGSDAVSFFFVLSGFVLSYRYLHSDAKLGLAYFYYKRVLRLYPAFIVTVLLNYFYWNAAWILNGDFSKLLADMFWKNDQQLWEELTMFIRQHKFYIPGWTMRVELILSLLMPFLIYLARKNIKWIWGIIPIAIFFGHEVFLFAFHFALGILLANYYPKIKDHNWKNNRFYQYRFIFGTIVFILFSIRHLDRMFPTMELHYMIYEVLELKFFHFTGLASALIILGIINNQAIQKLLVKPMLLFVGKISYSIYLVHWLIVVYIMDHWDRLISYFPNWYLAFGILLMALVITTILAATIMYYAIEKPFIRISKRN